MTEPRMGKLCHACFKEHPATVSCEPKTLDEIAARAFPEADHRAVRCRAALQQAYDLGRAEERKALREIVTEARGDWDVGLKENILAALDAREKESR